MNKIIAFFKLIRFINLLIIAFGLSLFYYLIIVPVHHNILQTIFLPFSPFTFALFLLSVICVAASGNIINDYFDFELDKEYKPERPLASGQFTLDTAMYMHVFFIVTGVALGFYLGWKINYLKVGYLYVICAVVLYVYSAQLKKMPFAGNVLISLLSGFVFILLLVFEAIYLSNIHAINLLEHADVAFNIITWQAKFYAGFAFLTTLAREIVKDMEDKEGDAAFNISTLPVQFGNGIAKLVTGTVLLIMLGVIGYMMKGFWQVEAKMECYYFIATVVIPAIVVMGLLFSAEQKAQFARISLLLKVIMLLGILSIPAFYFFHQ